MDYDPYGNYVPNPQKEDFGVNANSNPNANLGRTTGVNVNSNTSLMKGPVKPIHCMYSIFHMIISVFAIYLSFKCNGTFVFFDFLAALLCPYLYIIYRFAVSENFCQK